jgi:Acetyltransferase (GNAT) domain
MYVLSSARRSGIGRALLVRLEEEADKLGYTLLKLQTGNRQLPAMALYESYGFIRIPPFGAYVNDPISVCYAKMSSRARSGIVRFNLINHQCGQGDKVCLGWLWKAARLTPLKERIFSHSG